MTTSAFDRGLFLAVLESTFEYLDIGPPAERLAAEIEAPRPILGTCRRLRVQSLSRMQSVHFYRVRAPAF